MKLIEGEMAENDPAVASKAFSLANYAVRNEFMLSPAFADLYRKYASLNGGSMDIRNQRQSYPGRHRMDRVSDG